MRAIGPSTMTGGGRSYRRLKAKRILDEARTRRATMHLYLCPVNILIGGNTQHRFGMADGGGERARQVEGETCYMTHNGVLPEGACPTRTYTTKTDTMTKKRIRDT